MEKKDSKKKSRNALQEEATLPSYPDDENQIHSTVRQELREAEEKATSFVSSKDNGINWKNARQVIEDFNPVPWYVWRIVNFVIGRSSEINTLDHGMVFALKKLLLLAANDPDLNREGTEIKTAEEAIKVVASDSFAACAVIHAISKKLSNCQFARVWNPILEEALLRARIGYALGSKIPQFGCGRGMLAGFAGRSGLAVQIATGTADQAKATIDKIAQGGSIQRIGHEVYRAEPLQVSAMMLIASGAGRDAAYGIMAVAAHEAIPDHKLNREQIRWRAALLMMEQIRSGNISDIPESQWNDLGYVEKVEINSIKTEIRQISRRGHTWGWMAQ